MSLLKLFCAVDDFWLAFRPFWEQQLITEGRRQRRRETQLAMSEIMTELTLAYASIVGAWRAMPTLTVT